MKVLPFLRISREPFPASDQRVKLTPAFRLGEHVWWFSYPALVCSLVILVPLADLVGRGRFIPGWLLDAALVIALAAIGHLLAELSVLRGTATVDVLTGTMARRAMEGDIQRLVRGERPFGLVFVDVDGMKQVNDMHGHDAGDALLRYVADRLHYCVRPTDLVYRYGGDEFVVLLPGADDQVTGAVCERITQVMAGVASAGAAAYPRDGEAAAAVLKAADSAMYAGRRQRRSGG